MTRRGPDDAGLQCGPGFALGHRRLSIIDLSPAGHQPMENEDGLVVITFNGEIYNFADLRPALEAAGHRFRSRTDTEMLLHGYEQWGLEGLLRRIRGMYAFAIVDLRRAATIHLVRDPLGKKPLFFRWSGGELLFASSARALAEALDAPPDVDPVSVDALLWNRYIPGPRTIFAGVEKLPPGHAWSLANDGSTTMVRHWRPDFIHPEEGIGEDVWLERVEDALTTAVRRRFVADVPVGVMLSGGVDSSLVTAIAAKTMGAVETFCVANEDAARDESRYALAVARRYHTDHHVLPVRSDARANLPQLVAAMGEPLADASAANLLAIAQLARRSVTVVLTGDGGDEAFGGYTEFWGVYWAERIRRRLPGASTDCCAAAPSFFAAGAEPCGGQGPFSPWPPTRWRTPSAAFIPRTPRCGGGCTRPRSPPPCRGINRANISTMRWPPRPAPPGPIASCKPTCRPSWPTITSPRWTWRPWAPVSKAAVRFSISTSSSWPCACLRKVRFRGGRPKGLLRELARRYLPAAGVDRRKQGFDAPIGLWFRLHWNDLTGRFILGPNVERRRWFRREALEQLVEEHARGADHGQLLWALLILELWLQMAVERTLSPEGIL